MSSIYLTVRRQADRYPWAWSFLAVVATWIAISAVSGRGMGGTMTSTLALAPFLVLVGLGQMLVISAGYGNIDLSIPYVMTLTGFLSVGVMDGGHGSVVLGLLAALGCGLLVGLANVFCILALSIPPIVTTLATGLIVSTAATIKSGSFHASPDPGLHEFAIRQWGPVPVLPVVCVAVAVAAGFVLHRTRYGRSLHALGQSTRAAELAGVSRVRVLAVTYLASGAMAGIAGALLAAYSTPSLGIGDPYQLNSVAVVVLGGSLIAGGRSNVPGVWGATLFLTLLTTLLNVLHIDVAYQDITKGLLIIAVLSMVGAKEGG